MEVIFRANGSGTYAWEVRFDPDTETLPIHLFDEFERLRETLSEDRRTRSHAPESTPTPTIAFSPDDSHVMRRILETLTPYPQSTNELVERLPGLDYMTVRAGLLDLYAQGRIERTGSGGRGGFQYSLKTNT